LKVQDTIVSFYNRVLKVQDPIADFCNAILKKWFYLSKTGFLEINNPGVSVGLHLLSRSLVEGEIGRSCSVLRTVPGYQMQEVDISRVNRGPSLNLLACICYPVLQIFSRFE